MRTVMSLGEAGTARGNSIDSASRALAGIVFAGVPLDWAAVSILKLEPACPPMLSVWNIAVGFAAKSADPAPAIFSFNALVPASAVDAAAFDIDAADDMVDMDDVDDVDF